MTSENEATLPLGRRGWWILLAAGLLRLALALPTLSAPPFSDEIEYHGLAARLATGQGYVNADGRPTAYRPPGWPLALSALYRVTGPSVPAARIFQVVLGTALVALLLGLAGAAGLTPRQRCWLGWWAALSPALVYASHLLFSETLFTVCLLAALWALLRGRHGWAGVGLGLACLCRGSALVFTALTVVWLLRRRGWRPALVMALAAALMVAPWTVRNKRVLGDLIVVDTNGALNFFWGNHERAPVLRPWDLSNQDDKPWPLPPTATERQQEGAAMAAAKGWIRAHPWRFGAGLLTKTSALWGPDRGLASGLKSGLYGERASRLAMPAALLGAVESWLLLTLGFVGLVVGWARRRDLSELTALLAGALTLLHAVSFGHSRFRFGVAPLLMLAACALLGERLSPRATRTAWLVAAAVAANLIFQLAVELAR